MMQLKHKADDKKRIKENASLKKINIHFSFSKLTQKKYQ